MNLLLRVVAYLFCLIEVVLVAEFENPKDRRSTQEEHICLQCEKKRTVTIEEINFHAHQRLNMQNNGSQLPKCYFHHSQYSYKKAKQKIQKNLPESLYTKLLGWVGSVFGSLLNSKDYKECVDCQKITLIKRSNLKIDRTYFRNYLFARIFNFYKSCDQCPNPNYELKHFDIKKVARKNASNDLMRRTLLGEERDRKLCLNCSKIKKIISQVPNKHRKETNFMEYNMVEVFHLKQWKENLMVCLNITQYINKMFKKRVVRYDRNAAREYCLTTESKCNGKNFGSKRTYILLGASQVSSLKMQHKSNRDGDKELILDNKAGNESMKIDESNVVKGKLRKLLKNRKNERHSFMSIWIIFKLKCALIQPQRVEVETSAKENRNQKEDAANVNLNELFSYSGNEMYSYLPFLLLFRLKCYPVLLKRMDFDNSLGVLHTSRKAIAKQKFKMMLSYTDNNLFTYLPLWIIFRLKCSVALKNPNLQQKSAKRTNTRLTAYRTGDKYSYLSFQALMRLKCPSKPQKQIENNDVFDNLQYNCMQLQKTKSKSKLGRHLTYTDDNKYSYLTLWSIFNLKCPSSRQLMTGREHPADHVEREPQWSKSGQFSRILRFLSPLDTEKNSLIPFGNLFRLSCNSMWALSSSKGSIRARENAQPKLPELVKLFKLYSTGVFYTYILPLQLLKCAVPKSVIKNCRFSRRDKMTGRGIPVRSNVPRRVETHSANKRFCFQPFLLLFSLKCTLQLSHDTLKTGQNKIKSSSEIDNSGVCFVMAGMVFPLKCRLKKLEFKIESTSSELLASKIEISGNEINSILVKPTISSTLQITLFDKNKELTTVRYSNGIVASNVLGDAKSSIDVDNVSTEKFPENDISTIQQAAKCSNLPVTKHRTSKAIKSALNANELIEESSKRLHIPNLVHCSSSEDSITDGLKIETLKNERVVTDSRISESMYVSIAGHTALDNKWKNTVNTDLETRALSSDILKNTFTESGVKLSSVTLTSSANALKSSSSFSAKPLDSARSSVLEISHLSSVVSSKINSDFSLPFEATKSSKKLEILAVETSNLSLLIESPHESVSLTNKFDPSMKTTEVSSVTDSLVNSSSTVDSLHVTKDATKVSLHYNATRTTIGQSPVTSSGSSSTIAILPSRVPGKLPSHSQPSTAKLEPKKLGQNSKNKGDAASYTLAAKDSKEKSVISAGEVSADGDSLRRNNENEKVEKGHTAPISADVVILFTLVAMACYKLLKSSFGNLSRTKPTTGNSLINGTPPDEPDQKPTISSEKIPEVEETPSALPKEGMKQLELETVIAVADIFMKQNGEIGFEIRRSKAG